MLLSRSFRNLMMGTAFAVSLTATQVLAQDAPDGGQLTSREAIALQDQIASLRQQVSQVQNAPMPAPSASPDLRQGARMAVVLPRSFWSVFPLLKNKTARCVASLIN